MKVGDMVRATWTDGLVLEGKYVRTERGFVILQGLDGVQIVCDPNAVQFEVIDIPSKV